VGHRDLEPVDAREDRTDLDPYSAGTGASGTLSPSIQRCTRVWPFAEIGSGIGMPASKAARSNLKTSSTW
jgi:hypothetical protein